MAYYSNVNLPQKPEYDSILYPYAVAEFRYGIGETDWQELRLYYSGSAFFYDTNLGCVTNGEELIHRRIYDPQTGTWSTEENCPGTVLLVPGRGETVFRRIWSEQILPDEQGRVFLQAGGVTNADWKGLESWLTGFLNGMSWIPFHTGLTQAPEKEQLYRYNSVTFPGLPMQLANWGSERIICWVPVMGCYRAFAGDSMWYETDSRRLHNTSMSYNYYYLSDLQPDGTWSECWESRVPNWYDITSYEVEPIWSDFDLYSTSDAACYLAGSEPVPITPEVPCVCYDPVMWLLGWQTGRQLAKQR